MENTILSDLIWPLAVALVTGVFIWSRKKIYRFFKKRKLKSTKITLDFKIDERNNLILVTSDSLKNKLILIRSLIKLGNEDDIEIKIKPIFKLNRLDAYQKKELHLKLADRALAVKKKLIILSSPEFDFHLGHPEYLEIVLQELIKRRRADVSGLTKLDIFRRDEPKIQFPVYLNKEELQSICDSQGKTVHELKSELLLQGFHTTTMFSHDLMLKKIYPEFVHEIYRITVYGSFSNESSQWKNIMSYNVGLG